MKERDDRRWLSKSDEEEKTSLLKAFEYISFNYTCSIKLSN